MKILLAILRFNKSILMKNNLFLRLIFAFFLFIVQHSCTKISELVIVRDGVSRYVIYHGEKESPIVKHAAAELKEKIDKITGSNIKITSSPESSDNLIIIGKNNPLVAKIADQMNFDAIRDDGFRIIRHNKNLFIVGAIDRGVLNGVYYLLDKYIGVRWYSPEFEYLPAEKSLIVTITNDLQNPRFAYREIFSGDTDDAYFRQHNRLNGNRWDTHRQHLQYPSEIDNWYSDGPASGHNMEDIISKKYHYGGQVMMMENGARKEAADYFINLIKKEGDKRWYALSQEDRGWQPDSLSKAFAAAHGGALSAPVVDMVSDVAHRVRKIYPKAHLSTDAYQWSFPPPKKLTVPPFVMVEIAPIEADFGYPYNDAFHNEEIKSAFDGWNQVASSLGVWDYITNFQNYLQPLPNIYPMCENIKYFASLTGIRSYFGEGAYNTKGAEFAELRAWVAARLLWNPKEDYRALIKEFCHGYYGPASKFILQYIDLLHQSFINSADRISSKQRITSDYLNIDFIMKADSLMSEAEAAVYDNDVFIKHVHEVRIGVDMTILLREHSYKAQAKKRGISWIDDPQRRLRFDRYIKEAGISDYGEDGTIESLQVAMDIKRKNPAFPKSIGINAAVKWIDYQDLDFSLCCGAKLVEDATASDNGAAALNNKEWAIGMKLDMLPPEGKWNLYALVRADVKKGTKSDEIAINMGIYPYWDKNVKVSEVDDGSYHIFKLSAKPAVYQTGSDIWFSCGEGAKFIYVDRIIAVKTE